MCFVLKKLHLKYIIYQAKKKRSALDLINLEELKQYKRIHLLGIGGTSMSGIAEILKKWGFYVTVSDANDSDLL